MGDFSTWKLIGGKKNFCSFKLHTDTETFCKNANNVTGICEQVFCPLANSKYATVREINKELFLFVKEPERINTPRTMYEQIKLSSDYNKALAQIDEELEFFDKLIIHKCKQRLTKLTQYLRRLEEIRLKDKTEITVENKKEIRREKSRALKALKKIDFEKEIAKEFLLRLESGVYGKEMKEKYANEEKEHIKKEEAKKESKKNKKRYVADFEESDTEIEDKKVHKNKNKKIKSKISW